MSSASHLLGCCKHPLSVNTLIIIFIVNISCVQCFDLHTTGKVLLVYLEENMSSASHLLGFHKRPLSVNTLIIIFIVSISCVQCFDLHTTGKVLLL